MVKTPLIAILLVALGGCTAAPKPTGAPVGTIFHVDAPSPEPYRQTPPPPPTVRGPARVALFRLILPLGTCSNNEKVWRQLNQDALDSSTSELMANNAIRAGTAPAERWPQIAKLLDVSGAKSQEQVFQTDGKTVVPIVSLSSVASQTLFYVDGDNVQHGRTYENCDNLLLMGMSSVPGTTQTHVELQPVVQLGTVTRFRRPGQLGVSVANTPEYEKFNNMRMTTNLDEADFLLIAPADPRHSRYAIGTRFLSQADQLPATETVFVFIPQALPAAGKPR